MTNKPKTFKWTVEFEIDESWVADGFNPDAERWRQMVFSDLAYAYDHEVKAKMISAPCQKAVATCQGFKSIKDMQEAS